MQEMKQSPEILLQFYKMCRSGFLVLSVIIVAQLLMLFILLDFSQFLKYSSEGVTSPGQSALVLRLTAPPSPEIFEDNASHHGVTRNHTKTREVQKLRRITTKSNNPTSGTKNVQIHKNASAAIDGQRKATVSGNRKHISRTWTFTRESMLTEGPKPKISKQRQDLLLLIRKLALFAIREVNQRISYSGQTECTRWWVNPLSVSNLEETEIYQGVKLYKIVFDAQPGNVRFVANIVIVQGATGGLEYTTSDLVFVNASRVNPIPSKCGSVPQNVRTICLCPEEKVKAEKVTAKLRFQWGKTDPELFSWPPDSPMFVSEYIKLDTNLYIKNPPIQIQFCAPEVKMIVFISSAPTHKTQRTTIRKTFGNPQHLNAIGARVLFLFGKIKNQTLQGEIDLEHELYGDIVQAEFSDSYHNLSMSHLAMYNWVLETCVRSQAMMMPKWVLKADDDFILNIPLALRVASANPEIDFLGVQFCGTKAVRDTAYVKKYYVPRYMYPPDYYAGYLSGVAYLVQTRVFKHILEASRNTPLTHMDDAYVMGLLTRELHIRPRNSKLFSYRRTEPNPCRSKLMVSSYVFNSTDMEVQWEALNKRLSSTSSCDVDQGLLVVEELNSAVNRFCFYE